MNKTHTPGPWTNDNGRIYANGAMLADCDTPGHETEHQLDANARLIAAAPDLLAERDRLKAQVEELRGALERAHEWCPLCYGLGSYPVGKNIGNPRQEQCEACADIRAALAKVSQ